MSNLRAQSRLSHGMFCYRMCMSCSRTAFRVLQPSGEVTCAIEHVHHVMRRAGFESDLEDYRVRLRLADFCVATLAHTIVTQGLLLDLLFAEPPPIYFCRNY